MFPRLILAWATSGLVLGIAPINATAIGGALPEVVEFNRDVRPILSNACFKCHGPDATNNASDLRLDLRDSATASRRNKAGRETTAIVPGDPAASEVWRRITSSDAAVAMPPPDALHQLTQRNRAVIKRWIEQGAPYSLHWAYVPPVRHDPPAVNRQQRVRNPIDAFILHQLDQADITPLPDASRATLIRRVSLDLTGLPPTMEELSAFITDIEPGAYERLVDRLLASPHYGERMAVPWLDVVRFADTVGFHGDQRQNNFPYRDYVIDAFNRNLPYDRFVREQLAGDLLPDATPAQRIASAFNRLNLMTREGGAQPKEYLAKAAADRVRAVSTVFLGSTMACAECHDHKYDPFTTRDFYATAAYFADVKQWGFYGPNKKSLKTAVPELEGFTNDHPFPPEIEVESPYLQRRLARLRARQSARVEAAAKTLLEADGGPQRVLAWARQHAGAFTVEADGWSSAPVRSVAGTDYTSMEALADGGARFTTNPGAERPHKDHRDQLRLNLEPAPGTYAVVRLDVLPDPASGGTVSRAESGEVELGLDLALLRAGKTVPTPLTVADCFAAQPANNYDNGYVSTSIKGRWKTLARLAREPQSAHWQLAEPLTLSTGDQLVATLASNDASRVRLHVSPLGLRLPGEAVRPGLETALAVASAPDAIEHLTDGQWLLLAQACFRSTGDPDLAAFAAGLADLRDIAGCRNGLAFTTVTVAVEPRVTRVLPRGNWQDDSGEIVQPAPPAFLSSSPAPDAPRATRLDLADWIASRDNPLTARSYVNRLWRQFFGTGLSAVVDDLGLQGEYPSHPGLLDWLAVEFMESGWDVKALVRLMVTSATYRQASRQRPDVREADPDNRLLSAANPRRLDAEFIRDNALFIAGLLDGEIGGPSAYPYQPEGYYRALNFPKRSYEASTDDRQYRRGIYTHWQRTFLHPMMANFDAPSREECTASRTLSNTPLQALTLLNDPSFVEAARALAERIMTESPASSFADRLDFGVRLVLARAPQPAEEESLAAFHSAQLAIYRDAPDDAVALTRTGLHRPGASLDLVELAAWTQVARVLLNLNETIMRY